MNRRLAVLVAMLVVMIRTPAAATSISGLLCGDSCEFDAVLSGTAEEPPNASPALGSAHVAISSDFLWLGASWGTHADPDLLGGMTSARIYVVNGPGDTNPLDTRGPAASPYPMFSHFGYIGLTGGFETALRIPLLDASTYNPEWVMASGGIEAAEVALITGLLSGRAYYEVTSSAFPDGEIRGFFTQTEPPAPIPEPASVFLLGSGLALLVVRRRRAA
jgi:hypothetical protein